MVAITYSEVKASLLDAAQWYLQQGWMPVYVKPGTKAPLERGWEKLRLTEADLPAHFDRPGNIGIILGEASGGLVDADLDCPEAIALADQYLPTTATETGRPGAPRSHRWYNSDVPGTKQFRDPKTGDMIVELRSTGGQTLVGPSIHPDTGEPYDYLNGEPERVPGPMLLACVEALYHAVLRQRYGDEFKGKASAPPRATTAPACEQPAAEVERRAIAYLAKMSPAISGQGGHNATYAAATVLVHGFGLPPDRALALLLERYNPRCQPPWTEKELAHKVEDAAKKLHEKPYGWLRDLTANSEVDLSKMIAKYGWQEVSAPTHGETSPEWRGDPATGPDENAAGAIAEPSIFGCPAPKYLGDLITSCPDLRPAVIQGLLRIGETMNVISAPKVGKSWLANDLALAVATGRPWLGFECVQGDVLIIDNELHEETLANRLPKVAAARSIGLEEVAQRIMVLSLRGALLDLEQIEPYFRRFSPGQFKLIILDAFHRFLPAGVDENDNGAIARLFNIIDRLAQQLKCAFVLIHHTSKGNQSSKDVTDVGAGAGSQSRATDAHVVLRHHEETGSLVLEAKVRSWPPVEPRCLTWQHPVWMPAMHLDPTALYHPERKRRPTRESEPDVPDLTLPEMSLQEFVQKYAGEAPRPKYAIIAAANSDGVSDHKAGRMLKKAESTDMLYRWVMDNGRVGYATVAQEALSLGKDNGASTKRKEVEDALNRTPGLSNREIGKRCGVAYSYVRRIRKERES